MIIIAITNIFIGGKILLPPEFVPSKKKKIALFKNALIRMIRIKFLVFGKSQFFLLDLNSKILTLGGEILNLSINISLDAFF